MTHTVTLKRQAFDPRNPAPSTLVSHVLEMTGDFNSESLQEKFGTNLLHSLNGGVSRVARGHGVTVITVDYGSLPKATRQLLHWMISERVMESLRLYAEGMNQWDLVRIAINSNYTTFRICAQLKGLV